MSNSSHRRLFSAAAGTSALALAAAGFALGATPATAAHAPSGADCLQAVSSSGPHSTRASVFTAAAQTYGVPVAVVKGVSYMESRWDAHGSHPSTSGGYGPMHLTDVSAADISRAKGDDSAPHADTSKARHTVQLVAGMTELRQSRLKSDTAANICGGAALLASYQRAADNPTGTHSAISQWYDAVRSYSGAGSPSDSARFARQVFTVVKQGKARTTNDGQRVALAAHPQLALPAAASAKGASPSAESHLDCPTTLNCEWIPAPYEWYAPDEGTGYYGNHDLADRPNNLKIDYIVIHDTEEYYDQTIDLVTDPTYLAWNYTIRSSDGHVAQHLDPKDVGWHAGNWYVNMHSIGIEHEGFAATGATWFTEAMYENSAELVKHLAAEYDIPLDRAHIIGHDQVPGILPAYVQGMHWDPGPYWDWEHYMSLMGAPIKNGRHNGQGHPKPGTMITVAPGFDDNQQLVTGCTEAGEPCEPQGTNFVYLHTQPSADSPLVKDIGLHPDGSYSTTELADIGARVPAGQKMAVADRQGDWVGVWYLGEIGWMHSTKHNAPIFKSHGTTVTVKPGADSAPVYGRAYPEVSAYDGYEIPPQAVAPLQYTIKPGQSYVLADQSIQSDYYYAKSFQCQYLPDDCTDVVGQAKYYEIYFGHRVAYVRAADVTLNWR